MTKDDLVKEISASTGIEKVTVHKTIDAFIESIKTSMVKDKNIYFRGFGSFILKKRATKKARNISKNTTVVIPEHYVPLFKPSPEFKLKIKNN